MNDDSRLADFRHAVANFRESSYDMVGPVDVLTEDRTLRAHATQTAYDVFACCEVFGGTYVQTHDEVRQQLRSVDEKFADWPRGENVADEEYAAFWDRFRERESARVESPEGEVDRARARDWFDANVEGRDASAAMGVALKALFLFLRAHQDSLCALYISCSSLVAPRSGSTT